MKKVLAILLALNAALMAGILLKNDVHVQAAGADAPVGNGDVNADGKIDIADVVYLLDALFLAGAQPIAIECPPAPGRGLPDTGVGACYSFANGQAWVEVPCGEVDCQGQDGAYSTGCAMEGRFVDNLDGTVTDNCTGLMWLKDTADVDGDGQITFDGDAVPWCEALSYCDDLILAGHSDWRLPNVRELQSIVDYGRYNPALDPVFGAELNGYWTSSTSFHLPDFAWYVNSGDGGVYYFFDKDIHFYVRAVRGGL